MADTDKALATRWANYVTAQDGRLANAASRYILATAADDRDARIAALTQQNAELLAALREPSRDAIARLTKERDEWKAAYEKALGTGPRATATHPGDEHLRNAVSAMEDSSDNSSVWAMWVEDVIKQLAKRALGES